MAEKKESAYRQSLKSLDTEEGIDLAFYRPIGYMWARLAARLGVTPNAITIASIFLGIGAGICFSFDSADGQLARMTRQYSRIGRILDGVSGDLWFAAIYIAICLRENVTSTFFMAHPWLIWVIAAVTGICHAKQAAMADYYRQFHLYFLKGEAGSELDRAFTLRRRLATLSWRHDFWQKLTLAFYTSYTVQQEATSPAMQQLRRAISLRYPDGTPLPESLRQAFRRASLPLMKYTNILSFNWRTIALFTALFLTMPWLYFVFELTVLNALLVMMVIRHERICRRFARRIEQGDFDE